MRVRVRWLIVLALSGIFLVSVGCSTTRVSSVTHKQLSPIRTSDPVESKSETVQLASFEESAKGEQPQSLSLNELLLLTRTRHPAIAASAARVGEAQGRLTQAGLYPNPTVGYSGNQINDGPGTAGQQGAFLSQEIVTGGKRTIASEAARYGVTAADWAATAQWFETSSKVSVAFYELVTARVVLTETELAVTTFAETLRRTQQRADAGKADSYDVSRLRVEQMQWENRVVVGRQRVAAAERLLATAVGVEQLAPITISKFDGMPNLMSLEAALTQTTQAPVYLAATAEADQARIEWRAAEIKPIPNVQTMTTVAHDFVTKAPMVSVQVGLPLPVWDRNQGNIASAQSRAALMTANIEQVRLRLVERLTTAYQRYENASRQAEKYRVEILPNAEASLVQIDNIYAIRGERFADTLDARRTLAQARIDYAQLQGDMWMAASEIAAIIEIDRKSNAAK